MNNIEETIRNWLPKDEPFAHVGEARDLNNIVLDGTFDLLELAKQVRKQAIEKCKEILEKNILKVRPIWKKDIKEGELITMPAEYVEWVDALETLKIKTLSALNELE